MSMAGKSGDQIKEEFEKISDWIHTRFNNVEIINSIIAPDESKKHTHLSVWYLGKSLELLADADWMFAPNVQYRTRGCRIEYDTAVLYNIPISEYPIDILEQRL